LPSNILPAWYQVAPPRIPKLLAEREPGFFVMLNYQLEPLGILMLEKAGTGCREIQDELWAILRKKYAAENSAADASKASLHKITVGETDVTVSCREQGVLVLDYVDRARYLKWHQRYQKAVAEYNHTLAVEYANRYAMGSRRRLEGILDVPFRTPLERKKPIPDVASSVDSDQKHPSFEGSSKSGVTVKVDPEGLPYEIRAFATFPTKALADNFLEKLSHGFREKYGTPMKDTRRHKIFNISSDYLILKRLSDRKIELAALYRMGQQKALRRKRLTDEAAARHAEEMERLAREEARVREEERQRQWEKDTEGL